MFEEYKNTQRRVTNEIESDDTAEPVTKRVLLYGWSGADKLRVVVDGNGYLVVVPSDLAAVTGNPLGILMAITVS